MELKKQLGFLDVFCIASGAMISSGIFILPGVAFARIGPLVGVSYLIGGIVAFLGILAIVELSTAMPKAGGDYFFITRSLGPLIGTISGVLSWFALSLKSAFAVFGLGQVVQLLTGLPWLPVSAAAVAVFVLLNIVGVDLASRFEVVLVLGLLAILGVYAAFGFPAIRPTRFTPPAPYGLNAIVSGAGFVFVSFGGLINVAGVSEEVRNPRRNLPAAILASVLLITVLYGVVMVVTVGVVPADELSGSLTPIADAAGAFLGPVGIVLITVASVLAFLTTANAGIMSASRYPMALSRDGLLPPFAGRVSKRFNTPIWSVLGTGLFITAALFLELEILVKAASTVILTTYVLANLAVIILRESRVQTYRPSFRTPLYPWLPGIGIVLFVVLIVDLGFDALEMALGFVALSALVYVLYGRRSKRDFALLRLAERATNRQIARDGLEEELLAIIHNRDEVAVDEVDRLFEEAAVLDIPEPMERDELFALLAETLAERAGVPASIIRGLLEERERMGSTALTETVAFPHLVLPGSDAFVLVVARCAKGVRFSDGAPSVNAVFLLAGTMDRRTLHLRALAAIAQIIQSQEFDKRWGHARNESALRGLLLAGERRRFQDT